VSNCVFQFTAAIDELRITADGPGDGVEDIAAGFDVGRDGESLPVLAFVENQPRSVRCTARGGYPVPDVALHLGDRDVTDSFALRHRIELQAPPLGANGAGLLQQHRALRVIRSVAVRWNQAFRVAVDAGDDGKILQCVGTVAGLEPNYTRIRVAVNC
jgi:hypothetical protein